MTRVGFSGWSWVVMLLVAAGCASDGEKDDMSGAQTGAGTTAAGTGGNAGGTGGGAGAGTAGMSTSGGTGGGAESVDCSQLSAPANPDDLIADFEQGTGATIVVEGRGGGFYMFNDDTGMQTPAPGALPDARMSSRCGGLYAMCMAGSGFTDWGAGMGTDLGPTDGGGVKTSLDLSMYSGIAFWARIEAGTTPVVRVGLKDSNTAPEGGVCDMTAVSGDTACNDDWSKTLNLTPEWKAYTIRFDELRQAGWGQQFDAFKQTEVYSVQFQISANLEFDMCIDDLMFVR